MDSMECKVVLPSSVKHPIQQAFIDCSAKRIVVRAGRRGGKTVGVAIKACKAFLDKRRVLYASPTSEQVGRFWTTVCAAFQEGIDKGVIYKNDTLHILEIPGTEIRIRAKSAWNADSLRGDYADLLILDEYQLMAEDTWELVGAPMLLDNDGNAIFIYTPPSLHSRSASKAKDPQHAAKTFLSAVLKENKSISEGTEPRWKTFHFSSMENPYISKQALSDITQDMTSLAYKMEILAQDVSEAPGALWTRKDIDKARALKAPDLERIVIGVDPSITSGGDEAGIIGAGKSGEEGYVLEDSSVQGSPLVWATAAVTLYHKLKADRIVAEVNQGGEMVSAVIHQVDPSVPVKMVHASRGKATRAEPISAKYEKGMIHHVGKFEKLEDEMCLWIPGDPSPNRLDALVWSFTDLLLGPGAASVRVLDGPESAVETEKGKCFLCGEVKDCVEEDGKLFCYPCLREKRAWEEMSKED
uniref:Putative terminase n=2 Tax=viral metagenome TaxID=1070528 RepID=A0A6M3ME34_9ZZZZ